MDRRTPGKTLASPSIADLHAVDALHSGASPDHDRIKSGNEVFIDWPTGEEEPIKILTSTLAARIGLPRLVDLAKLNWRLERDHRQLKR